jgi:FMN phosphatase YigB (HAD superfamily)
MLDHYSHIIFDFDETLATLQIDWTGWYEGISKIILKYEPGIELPGIISHTLFNNYVKKYGESIRRELWQFSAEFELSANKGIIPNKKAIQLLRSIPKNKHIYLFSSNSRKIILQSLKYLDIEEKFDKIITRDEVDFIKPDTHGFTLIYDGQTPLSQYIMIGDSSSDSGLARNAGIKYLDVKAIA